MILIGKTFDNYALCILFLKDIAFMGSSEQYIRSFFLYIIIFSFSGTSSLNAKCVCKCVNKKVEIICKKDSDIKPICMPFTCDNGLVDEIPKISPPETANVFNKGCEGSEIKELSGDKVLLREECQ